MESNIGLDMQELEQKITITLQLLVPVIIGLGCMIWAYSKNIMYSVGRQLLIVFSAIGGLLIVLVSYSSSEWLPIDLYYYGGSLVLYSSVMMVVGFYIERDRMIKKELKNN